MGISEIQPGSMSSAPVKSADGANGLESEISRLEQRLRQLGQEKEKAARTKNMEKVKEIEKEIQEIQRQIQQMKMRSAGDGNTEKSSKKEEAPADGGHLKDPSLGNYVDEMV